MIHRKAIELVSFRHGWLNLPMLLLQISPATPPPTGPPSPSAQPPGIIMGLCWLVKQHSVLVLFLFAMFCSQVLDIRYRQEKKPNLTYLWSLEDTWNSFPLSLALFALSLALLGAFGSLYGTFVSRTAFAGIWLKSGRANCKSCLPLAPLPRFCLYLLHIAPLFLRLPMCLLWRITADYLLVFYADILLFQRGTAKSLKFIFKIRFIFTNL